MNPSLRLLCLGRTAVEVAEAARTRGGWCAEVILGTSEALADTEGIPAEWSRADAVVVSLDPRGCRDAEDLDRVRSRLPGRPLVAVVQPGELSVAPDEILRRADDYLVADEAIGRTLERVVRFACEEKRFEDSLLRERDLFSRIWGRLTELVAVVGLDGRRLYSSPAYRRVLGDPAALLGTDSFREIHPEDEGRVRAMFAETMRTGAGKSVSFRFLLPDGTVRYIESEGTVVPGPDGRPDKLLVVGRDVTERWRMETELREREEFFRHISEAMTDLVAVVDLQGRRLYNSPSYRNLFGAEGPRPASDSFAEIHPDDRERIRRVFLETVETGQGQRAEFRFMLADGRVRYLESVGTVMRDAEGRPAKVLVVSRDTTERREAEKALAREHALLRTLIDRLPDFIFVKDTRGRFVVTNRAHARLVGFEDPNELVGKTDHEVFPPDLAARYTEDDEAVMGRGEELLNREEPVRHRDGRDLWVLTSKVPLRSPDGSIVGLVGMSRDITERRRTERQLRESQERLELVIRGSGDGVWDWDVVTNEAYFSPWWKGMLGYREDEIPNTFDGWFGLIHPDDRERSRAALQAYFDGSTATYELEHRLRHKDGTYRWILARGVALRDGQGRPLRMSGSHVDLTERRRTEARLREAARWESVTTLAAGVAHEVKNPLQTILLGVDYLAGRPWAAEGDAAELLASMRNAAHQADTIIRSLRDYAVQRQPQARPRDLNEVVSESIALMRYDCHRAGVELGARLAPRLPAVNVDSEQLNQVFWIVFRNALDAMARSTRARRLEVATGWTAGGSGGDGPTLAPPSPGGWVWVEVDDTGHGVPNDVLPRVFDLFFTTKSPGRGTGIGLALARRILELHGGTIQIANRPGGGARVTLTFPVTEPSPSQAP